MEGGLLIILRVLPLPSEMFLTHSEPLLYYTFLIPWLLLIKTRMNGLVTQKQRFLYWPEACKVA
jgi:hypothetical protein